MKVISTVNDLGLTQGKEYEVIEQSAGHYKVRLDNGNIAYRQSGLFTKSKEGQAADQEMRNKIIQLSISHMG